MRHNSVWSHIFTQINIARNVIVKVGKMKNITVLLTLAVCLLLTCEASAETLGAKVVMPVAGMVNMVDLGAKKCIPCKMMAPIIEELQQEYKGRAAVTFIDVWENPEEAKKFSIRTIPTQIFYDTEGNEVGRHEGFMGKRSIVAMFDKLGVKE
jgi:thioredoxin 1